MRAASRLKGQSETLHDCIYLLFLHSAIDALASYNSLVPLLFLLLIIDV